jgi:glutathione peroxidase
MRISRTLTITILGLVLSTVAVAGIFGKKSKKDPDPAIQNVKSIHEFSLNDIDGNPVSLSEFKGQAILLVNVASKCGYTYQYEGLQTLYETYQDRGFVILGFPANNFMNQEPGSNADIKSFCSLEYGVDFPMFEKISVKGKDKHPLYVYLTDKSMHPETGGEITWNFNKFLINGEGQVVDRFATNVDPDDPKLISAVEALL